MRDTRKKYDQHCTVCDWQSEIFAEPGTHPACPVCQGPTERIYLGGYGMIGDEIPGGLVVENLGHHPVKVFSKSELKFEAEKRGLVQNVQHVGTPGGDKNPNTQRWV